MKEKNLIYMEVKKMKKVFVVLLLSVILCSAVTGEEASKYEKEHKAIKALIEEAYIKGVFTEQNPELMRKGFHPGFNMLILKEGKIVKISIDKWIEMIEERKKNPEPSKSQFTHKVPMVNVTGNAAVAKVEIYKDSKHIYSDYMSLYQFKDGWKIVNKIFHKHN
ncbi:MAG: nuclear transport factor 2 family protein [Candidatus Aminicenantes bacterium]|nr:MAG: nuclear transport factor 2 family protein [Candidatus Aminicenantes bacterium]